MWLLTQPALSCVELSGQARQGALLWGTVAPGSEVYLDQEWLQVSAAGVFVLGFGRDETGARNLRVVGEESCESRLHIDTREYRVQRVEGVPQQTVTMFLPRGF